MRRVYLIKESIGQRDIRMAEHFGDITTCLKNGESLSTGMMLNRLRSTLREYGEGDYILWAGGEWQILLGVGAVLKEMGIKHADLLVWKRTTDGSGTYVPNRMVF